MRSPRKQQGFILVYTVLILSIILITGGIFVETVIKEIGISRDEAESLKAFYAADSGIECVRFLKNKYDVFNPSTPVGTYDCGIGSSFQMGNNPTTVDCVAKTYNFTMTGFSNGACTQVTVDVVPRPIIINGTPTVVCDAEVVSAGKNSCSFTGNKLVERTRWETM